jgi:hypothetical protein
MHQETKRWMSHAIHFNTVDGSSVFFRNVSNTVPISKMQRPKSIQRQWIHFLIVCFFLFCFVSLLWMIFFILSSSGPFPLTRSSFTSLIFCLRQRSALTGTGRVHLIAWIWRIPLLLARQVRESVGMGGQGTVADGPLRHSDLLVITVMATDDDCSWFKLRSNCCSSH